MITIRKATKKDLPQIKKIDTFGEILATCSPLDKLDPKYKTPKNQIEYHEEFIIKRNKWCYIAEKEKQIIGFILFNIEKREPYWKIKKIGYIDLVVIEKTTEKKAYQNSF